MQFDYLLDHGLEPEHRMLDIGCGNLRAGRRLIDHLDEGNHYGIDVSPDILMAVEKVLAERGLQHDCRTCPSPSTSCPRSTSTWSTRTASSRTRHRR